MRVVALGTGIFFAAGQTQKDVQDPGVFKSEMEGDVSSTIRRVLKGDVTITMRYVPTTAILLPYYHQLADLEKGLSQDTALDGRTRDQILLEQKEKISKAKGMYDGSLYFAMTIGYEDSSRDIEYEKMRVGLAEYKGWINKLMFDLADYIRLESPEVSNVPLAVYSCDRTFGINRDRTFLLGFPRNVNGKNLIQKNCTAIKVVVDEFGLNVGRLEFLFSLTPENEATDTQLRQSGA